MWGANARQIEVAVGVAFVVRFVAVGLAAGAVIVVLLVLPHQVGIDPFVLFILVKTVLRCGGSGRCVGGYICGSSLLTIPSAEEKAMDVLPAKGAVDLG